MGRAASRGFSLIELMIAITLGMVLVAGLSVLFSNSSQSGTEVNKSIRQIENGRYASELLAEDVNLAGYYGDLVTSGLSFVNSAPCATAVASLGWDNAAQQVPVAVTGLAAAEAAALGCLTDHKAGTSALIVRRVDPTGIAPASVSAGNAYVQTSRCATDAFATRFIVSGTAADFLLKNQACSGLNVVHRYVTRIYYVASCSECPGDTIPTLKRVELSGSQTVVTSIAEGIDDIAFDYAFDTNGDGMADVYLTGLNVAVAATNTWANVIGIRLNLLSRATEPSAGYADGKTYDLGLSGTRGPFTDGFKRRAYTMTARLNNVAGPREVQ
jgi:type IV pilus assembly protein PilW